MGYLQLEAPRFALICWVDGNRKPSPSGGRLWCGAIAEAPATTGAARQSAEIGELSPPCCVRTARTTPEYQDFQYQEIKESLEPWVLSGLLVTFLPREKSPAGGKKSPGTQVPKENAPRRRQRRNNPPAGTAPPRPVAASPVRRLAGELKRGRNPLFRRPAGRPRRSKLRISRFRPRAKAQSLRCSSSPHRTRFAGLRRGPRKGVAASSISLASA